MTRLAHFHLFQDAALSNSVCKIYIYAAVRLPPPFPILICPPRRQACLLFAPRAARLWSTPEAPARPILCTALLGLRSYWRISVHPEPGAAVHLTPPLPPLRSFASTIHAPTHAHLALPARLVPLFLANPHTRCTPTLAVRSHVTTSTHALGLRWDYAALGFRSINTTDLV